MVECEPLLGKDIGAEGSQAADIDIWALKSCFGILIIYSGDEKRAHDPYQGVEAGGRAFGHCSLQLAVAVYDVDERTPPDCFLEYRQGEVGSGQCLEAPNSAPLTRSFHWADSNVGKRLEQHVAEGYALLAHGHVLVVGGEKGSWTEMEYECLGLRFQVWHAGLSRDGFGGSNPYRAGR